MLLKRILRKRDKDGYQVEESTEVWVADFGTDIHDELHQEVLKLKPRSEANFSWVLVSIVLLFFLVVTELVLRQLGLNMYWSETQIFWATWIWRFILVFVWLLLARLKWLLSTEKMFVTTVLSFVTAIIILGVIKIIYVKSAWAWLNLLVEPIWMILLIALVGVLVIKFSKNKTIKTK